MPLPFRQKALKTPFAKDLLAVRSDWEERVASNQVIEEPNRIAILGASAGATVMLGATGTQLIDAFGDSDALIPKPDGSGYRADRIIQFAHALSDVRAVEAAYRVVTWGLIAELGAFFWRPNYEVEMYECADAFEFRNSFEGEVVGLGEPAERVATTEGEIDRRSKLVKGGFVGMIGAALEEPIESDHYLVRMWLPRWAEQFQEGLEVANERIKQLSPEGLPIWEEEG